MKKQKPNLTRIMNNDEVPLKIPKVGDEVFSSYPNQDGTRLKYKVTGIKKNKYSQSGVMLNVVSKLELDLAWLSETQDGPMLGK